ncbi:SLC13 family permease [Cytobacillus purgationiresistens]|uniref:Sodium-dependent dicarboxylate transporter SdcS n=1 Tax=Cytobacillus purgationiresistens TaxID=863449 RepID=A0ABU0AEL4_9BACI|nr:DASS family sodium-coupled anion symporter [Cytobacillus purgationiresistens]MDQ0269693.1 anion transporter [Cytobacillus purgationiresistens]
MGLPEPLVSEKADKEPSRFSNEQFKKIILLILGVCFMAVIYWILPGGYSTTAKLMISLLALSVFYWTFEPIPLGMTSVLLLVLMLILDVASIDIVFSGFSSPALFLIIAGMMLAKGVNATVLPKRMAFYILAKWGGNAKGLLASIIMIPQVQAFFIPTAAVRSTLLMPIALMSLDYIGDKGKGNLRKMILLGVAFGGTISGTIVLTAAIGNILAVELLKEFTGIQITYIQWFLYTVPIWLLLIPASWFVLLKCFPLPKGEEQFPHVKAEMGKKLKSLGRMGIAEKKCLAILFTIVCLWFSEPFHGLNPAIPALVGVILMSLPGTGIAKWEDIVKINFDTILLTGATLSLGYAFNDSGASQFVGNSLSAEWILNLLQSPIMAVTTILIITHILHLAVANVSTAVVTLIPIYIGLSASAGVDPVLICLTAALACLHGYILVVESTPNIVVYSSGQIQQKIFLLPGLIMTLVMIVVTIAVAMTWWNWIGLM